MIKKYLILTVAFFTLVNCAKKEQLPVEVIKYEGLEAIMTSKNEKIQVINFWATWCAPCVKELPYFEEVNASMRNRVSVNLISLDFADDVEKKVLPFVRKKALRSKVYLLDEIDYNSWIDKVDPGWSGAIPATLIVDNATGKRKFIEKELKPGELENILKEFTD